MKYHTRSEMNVYLGAETKVGCLTYAGAGPILTVDCAGLHLSLSVDDPTRVTVMDVENARALVEAVTTYLAECERLFAQRGNHTGSAGERTS